MTYPFVAAESWSRGSVPVRAIVIHLAEGGGTVSWLTRPDGNSSHYVVEYTGRVVQMVREDRAAGSINPLLVRTTDDSPFTFDGAEVTYGVTAAKAALGPYWSNPNAAVIAIETEGFAVDGPNAKQRAALAALVADIRSRQGAIPALGHRDFQNYKACPGHKIHWQDYGGHGVAGDDVRYINAGAVGATSAKLLPVTAGQVWQTFDSPPFVGSFSTDQQVPVFGRVDSVNGAYAVLIATTRVYPDGVNRPTIVMVKSSVALADLVAAPPPVTPPAPASVTYPVTVGGKPAGSVTLP